MLEYFCEILLNGEVHENFPEDIKRERIETFATITASLSDTAKFPILKALAGEAMKLRKELVPSEIIYRHKQFI